MFEIDSALYKGWSYYHYGYLSVQAFNIYHSY